ncbi:hypothetical protein Tco_0052656 [Tanacetum coccineum]
MLSYVRRLQLRALILALMQVYWAFVFIIPKTVVKDIDKLLKGFLWCKGEISRGKVKGQWKCPNEWYNLHLILNSIQVSARNNDLKDETEWITNDGKRVKYYVNRAWKDWRTSDTTVS